MAKEEFKIPVWWGLSDQQSFVIGTLMDKPGKFTSPYVLCDELYPDDGVDEGDPAPAKLRVLVQRCRDIVEGISDSEAEIETKRGKGWRITRKSHAILAEAVEPETDD